MNALFSLIHFGHEKVQIAKRLVCELFADEKSQSDGSGRSFSWSRDFHYDENYPVSIILADIDLKYETMVYK